MKALWIAIEVYFFSFLIHLILLYMHVLCEQYFARLLSLPSLPYSCFLVSVDLQINYHDLISRDLYLGFKKGLPYSTFLIGNLNLQLRLDFKKHAFLNKELFFRVLFIIFFLLKNKKISGDFNFYKNQFFTKKCISPSSEYTSEKCRSIVVFC